MDIDFLKFNPEDFNLKLFGFDKFIVFTENPEAIPNDFIKGYLIKPKDVKDLKKKLLSARRKWIVGVLSERPEINMEAVMRKKVDIILDFEERKLDYTAIKLASEKDITIELCFSKFLTCRGSKRARLLKETIETIKILKKFEVPFVLSSGAREIYEMRQKKQIYDFFAFLGADVKKSKEFALKLYKKYADPNYIMNGLEIIGEIKKGRQE
ncbi:hypothetical protein DRO30_02990 [Candidatus Bathyarchaeota archaeon]|nr:MAG: hypothetical protein DRO30_02990 [Candidatus Bathyarchaeota archaeon]